VSAYNSSVLLSTGVASVDDVLGGGCPLGSILLVEEDQDTSYAKLLLKYWIAQALCCPNQEILLASSGLDQAPEEIISKLPYSDDAPAAEASSSSHASTSANATTDDEDDSMAGSSSGSMKIAFRYEGMKKFETSVRSTSSVGDASAPVYCSVYDLTKTMDLSEASRARIATVDTEDQTDPYSSTLEAVRKSLSRSSQQ
jgi:elongator complex protein 4